MEQLLFVSLMMSVVILMFLIHRKFRGERLSRRAYYLIWIIISIRLILPLDISMKNPIYKLTTPIENYRYKDIQTTDEIFIKEKENINQFIRSGLWKIWLIGASIYFLYNILIYILFKSKVMKSLYNVDPNIKEIFYNLKMNIIPDEKIDIRESRIIDSPMIIGLIKPVLLIPKDITPQDIELIFRHEFIHLKRKDIFYKAVIFLSSIIHWFNPTVHIMGKIAREDLELSCDEEMTKDMCRADKIRYSKALIGAITRVRMPIYTTSFSGTKTTMKKRLDEILDDTKKKMGKDLIIFSLIFILSISLLIGYETKRTLKVTEVRTFVNSNSIMAKLEYQDDDYHGDLYETYREMRNFRWYVTYKGIVE